MALLCKVKWLRLANAAPHLWRLNINQNALLALCGILLSGIVGARGERVIVGHNEIAIMRVLQLHAALGTANPKTQMQSTRGRVARQNAGLACGACVRIGGVH